MRLGGLSRAWHRIGASMPSRLFAAGMLVTCVLTAFGLREFSVATGRVQHADAVIHSVQELRLLLVDAETSQRGFVITGVEGYLAVYRAATNDYAVEAARLHGLAGGRQTPEGALADRLAGVADAKLAELARVVDARRQDGFEAAQKMVLTDLGKNLMDEFRRLSFEFLVLEAVDVRRYEEAATEFATWTLLGLVASVAFLLNWASGWMRRPVA